MLNDAHNDDPVAWFAELFAAAEQSEVFDASRAALATVDADGSPSVRYVLVKEVDARGFCFYTNVQSRKARALASEDRAALAFHWSSTGVQVRIEGRAQRLSEAESDAYFATRPRGSQLAAWASDQSEPIAQRADLEAQLARVQDRFAPDLPITRPPYWGGFRLVATRIEVWKDRPFRLHDRFLFTRDELRWRCVRLQP